MNNIIIFLKFVIENVTYRQVKMDIGNGYIVGSLHKRQIL